ncbi:MAG: elongation factor G [Ruminococcaceae bacterium]|nr:elongation factor G [Oscillospiraceae bacterium]
MATYNTKQIRNIALAGHGDSGKTSLAEAMLFVSGGTDRLGNVPAGNTVCDYDAEEQARKFSLSASLAHVFWKDVKINIIDTPGYLDFEGEVKQATRVADSVVICVDGKSGMEVGTELAWDRATEAGVPKAFFINKCDLLDAHFNATFDQLREKFGKSLCPVFIPVGKNGKDITMIDLLDMQSYVYDDSGKRIPTDTTPDLEAAAERYKEVLWEAVAGTSEELMMKFFDGEPFTKEECVDGLHQGIIDGSITPVYCGAATRLWGVVAMMDSIAASFPRHTAKKVEKTVAGDVEVNVDGEPALFVFKTVADPFVGKMSFFKVMSGSVKKDAVLKNSRSGSEERLAHIYIMKGNKQVEVDELACGDIGMISKLVDTNTNDTLSQSGSISYTAVQYATPYYCRAMYPLTAKDESKISQAIARMTEEDMTLRYENNPETKQQLIYAMGDMHLTILAANLKNRFGVNIRYDIPAIPYREKITKTVDVEGKHKKQNGGSGQYGHVWIKFSPSEEEGLTFTVSVVGGAVPKNFNPAVEKGLQDAMLKGAYGYPMTRLAADLHDGSYHDVDSDELSFKTAASLAYKKCLEQAGPVLLEPVGNLDVTVPESLVGDVMGDLNKRRGAVMGMDAVEGKIGYTVVHAMVPKAELADYPTVLRAMTQGRGYFDYEVTGYETVPMNVAQKIVG